MERVTKEIRKMVDHLRGLNLNDLNLMKAINCQVLPVTGLAMNVCNLGKDDLEELDVMVYYGEKDFMEDNQAMRYYIQG